MSLTLKTNVSGYEKSNNRDAVSFALKNSLAHARQRFEHYSTVFRRFEKKYRMTSNKIARRFEEGSLGDEQEYFDWSIRLQTKFNLPVQWIL